MVSFDGSQPASITAPEVTRHFSLMSCVNALGHSFNPILMIQWKRLMKNYAKGLPDCMIAMSESGYMTKEAFLAWGISWEKATRPADPKDPRVMAYDGHFSNLVVDLMCFLLEHNVRVCTCHFHTPHRTCVTGSGPFMSSNQHLPKIFLTPKKIGDPRREKRLEVYEDHMTAEAGTKHRRKLQGRRMRRL